MKNKKVILLLISLTLLVGIVHPDTRAVFAEESAFTCDTESDFYAEANQPYIAPEVPTEEKPEEEPEEEPAFTCDRESGFYAEANLLYPAPGVLAEEDRICTCNPSPAEGEEHQKDCPLYVEQTWQGEEAEIKYQIVGPENCGTLDNEKELLRLPVSSTETGFADENLGASGASTEGSLLICTASYPAGPQYTLSAEVLADSIQSVPEKAVQEAWDVTISNGRLSVN